MRTGRSRRLLAAAVAVLVVAAAEPDGGSSSRDVIAADQGWYSAMTIDAGETVVDPLAANTIQQGELPVGAAGTTEHKRSYLLLEIPEGATGATLTLEQSTTEGTSFGAPGTIVACPVIEPFAVVTAASIDEAPEVDCSAPVVGTLPELAEGVPDPAGAFTFDITQIMARWAAGEPDNGIALVADTTEPQPLFQVTFAVPYFSVVGTATPGTTQDAPDPGPDGPPGGASSFPPPSQGSTGPTFSSSSPGFDTSPVDPGPPAPEVAPSDEAAAPVGAGGPEVVATSPLAQPLDPLPVAPIVWLLIPLFASGLAAAWRGMGRAGQPDSALDRALTVVRQGSS